MFKRETAAVNCALETLRTPRELLVESMIFLYIPVVPVAQLPSGRLAFKDNPTNVHLHWVFLSLWAHNLT